MRGTVSVRGTVSPTSAQRFAAKVRRRRRNRLLAGLAVVTLLGGSTWLALLSPWTTVQRIEVTGTDRVSLAAVRDQAEPELGHPMLLARTGDIRSRIARQPLVRGVSVQRHWPSTVRIHVVERVPAAALPVGRGSSKVALVDVDGVVIEQVAAAPAGLATIQVEVGTAGVAAMRECLAVLAGLPDPLAAQVNEIGADSPDGVWLTLKAGSRVEWGNAEDGRLKAQVLAALLPQKAALYDVRSPQTPAVRRK